MKQPVHPGSIVRLDCIKALGLSVTKAACALGISRTKLSNLINGRAAISPEMAIRLAKAFGSRPEAWLKMQLAFDLAQVRRLAKHINVKRICVSRTHVDHVLAGLTPIDQDATPRTGGQWHGKIAIGDDFDSPDPETERLFSGEKP